MTSHSHINHTHAFPASLLAIALAANGYLDIAIAIALSAAAPAAAFAHHDERRDAHKDSVSDGHWHPLLGRDLDAVDGRAVGAAAVLRVQVHDGQERERARGREEMRTCTLRSSAPCRPHDHSSVRCWFGRFIRDTGEEGRGMSDERSYIVWPGRWDGGGLGPARIRQRVR